MEFSIINYYGLQQSRCGYCKGTDCSIAHGMHAYNISPQDYQDLIDRGWRRSGHYCYKPCNNVTCCPSYTIRCDALDFKLTKSHKKILKRVNCFLRNGQKEKIDHGFAEEQTDVTNNVNGRQSAHDEPRAPNVQIPDISLEDVAAANPERHAAAHAENQHFDDIPTQSTNTNEISNAIAIENLKMRKQDTDAGSLSSSRKSYDGINPPIKKAKQMRLERRQAKLAAKGELNTAASTSSNELDIINTNKVSKNKEKSLDDYLTESSSNDKHKLKIKFVHVKSKEFFDTLKTSFALFEKYQTNIHYDPPENVKEYLSFLAESPLQLTQTHDGPTMGYGSFHQQYWLDDKLIAVGVIDILPYCVSSVYFFYDPDYNFLSLGTYGSLREIHLVQELAKNLPALKYYYMGYYIHSCPKMRYKGKLVPSYLLCPEAYTWNLLTEDIRRSLDSHKYMRFEDNTDVSDEDAFREKDLDSVLLLVDNSVETYKNYIQITGDNDDRDMILEYGKLVGKTCAHRMLYFKT